MKIFIYFKKPVTVAIEKREYLKKPDSIKSLWHVFLFRMFIKRLRNENRKGRIRNSD